MNTINKPKQDSAERREMLITRHSSAVAGSVQMAGTKYAADFTLFSRNLNKISN